MLGLRASFKSKIQRGKFKLKKKKIVVLYICASGGISFVTALLQKKGSKCLGGNTFKNISGPPALTSVESEVRDVKGEMTIRKLLEGGLEGENSE